MVVNGKKISQEVLKKLAEDIQQKKLRLQLAVVLVSRNLSIRKFVELKGKAAKEVGVEYIIIDLPETISEDELKKETQKAVQDNANDGVLVELPLPKGIDVQNILNEIALEKDVDVLSQEAQDEFFSNRPTILPPAVEAVKTVLEFYSFDIRGKKAVVFGHGLLVGKPVAHWLAYNGASVSVVDEHTENPSKYSLEADVIVSGVGKPELVSGDMVKEGVVAIDFGYENKEGKTVGDFKFDEVAPKAKLITPVPGGVGPIVVASVLGNLFKLNSSK